MSSEAHRRAIAKYQKKLIQFTFRLDPEQHSDVIEYWKAKGNMRQTFVEKTRELIEKERQ